MSQYYTIKGLKRGEVWHNDFGEFQGYSLSLEGLGEPVSLNKKVPVAVEPAPGDKLYGTVEMLMSKAGKTYYKFKAEKEPDDTYTAPQPQNPSQGSYEGHSDKEDSIARAVALKAAVEFNIGVGVSNKPQETLLTADIFLAWLKNDTGTSSVAGPTPSTAMSNEVKPPAAASGYDKAKQARQQLNEEPLPEEPEDLLGWINEGNEHDND